MSDKRTVEKNEAVSKLDAFWKRNQKIITIASLVVIVGIIGWWAYKQYFVKPKEEKAQAAVYKAQQYFALDSFRLALNGDSTSKGFLYIIKNYGGTKTAELSHYYAGISFLKLEEFDNAIKYLKDFSTDSKTIQMIAWGSLGHAYAEKGERSKAIDLYKKAGRHFQEAENASSEYLFLAAQLLELENKKKEAVEVYKELKEKFPRSDKGGQADRYIYRLEVQPNEFSTK